MGSIDQKYNTVEYAEWLEARANCLEQPAFIRRHEERATVITQEIATRIYASVEHFLELVEDDIDYLKLRWKQEEEGPKEQATYCSFRIIVRASGEDEIVCGYQTPPDSLVMNAERTQAFNMLIESCELVHPDIWNDIVHYAIFNANEISNRQGLIDIQKNDDLHEFIAAREQWLMERNTMPATGSSRPSARM